MHGVVRDAVFSRIGHPPLVDFAKATINARVPDFIWLGRRERSRGESLIIVVRERWRLLLIAPDFQEDLSAVRQRRGHRCLWRRT